jgi:hypothetical protein
MNKLAKHKALFLVLLTSLGCGKIFSQESKLIVIQDQKLEHLLKEKRKINLNNSNNEYYKIQIFYGNSEESKKSLQEFKKEFKEIDATIIYNSPNYKVWIGNYKTRIEVEKMFLEIKKKYPNALIMKPSLN